MEVKSSESVPASEGAPQFFMGKVHVRQLFNPDAPSRMSCGCVTFDPSARSNWHTHPLGQTLIVLSGRGFVQAWGEAVREIKAGDVIWTPASQKHWHGAAPDSGMTHIAMQESLDGRVVQWMEKVTNEQYEACRPH